MTPASRTPVFVLSIHAPYACGRSGVCCASGWDIPVDMAERLAIGRAVERRLVVPAQCDDVAGAPMVWSRDAPDLPSPGVAVLARQASGDCVFLERSGQTRCLLQTACGHEAMPMACQQFPRVSMADDRGLHVTLSHHCPTAADLLWRDDNRSVEVLEDPSGWSANRLVAGLDARGHWPPLLRPGVLFTHIEWTRWERFCVGTWARAHQTPAAGLAALSNAAESLRRWTPACGPLGRHLDSTLGRWDEAGPADDEALDAADALRDWHAAWSAVPAPRATRPQAPGAPHVERARDALDAERAAVSRYLASRCVASWAAYQCCGVRAFVASVRMAAHVLLVETARGSEASPRARVREAVRRADLLLLHLAESAALARAWDQAEMNGPTRD